MKRPATLLAVIALVSACGGDHIPTAATARVQLPAAATLSEEREGSHHSLARDLATLRHLTAPFHSFAVASAAGWGTQITGCMVDPGGAGGMGFHYGNTAYIDGTAAVDKPQLLLYEPHEDGRLTLVAVEYIIPYSFHARSAAPPVLFGQQFQQVDSFGLWGLHVWLWKENPSGLFAPWNPRVTCSGTSDAMVMAH